MHLEEGPQHVQEYLQLVFPGGGSVSLLEGQRLHVDDVAEALEERHQQSLYHVWHREQRRQVRDEVARETQVQGTYADGF